MGYKEKKQKQLGMNPSTAQHRLRTNVMFKLVIDAGYKCFQCGGELTRETFSIEHKVPWLDDADPIKLFFDLENIAFSHLTCNTGAARKVLAKCGTPAAYRRGCKCEKCLSSNALRARKMYTTENRKRKHHKAKDVVERYTRYYKIYAKYGFDEFVQRTAYARSKQNLVMMFKRHVREFIPQNGRKRGS